jgi:hypothetical protein
VKINQWIAIGSLARPTSFAVSLALIIANVVTFYERVLTPSEVWFFWVPLIVIAVYWLARDQKAAKLARSKVPVPQVGNG